MAGSVNCAEMPAEVAVASAIDLISALRDPCGAARAIVPGFISEGAN